MMYATIGGSSNSVASEPSSKGRLASVLVADDHDLERYDVALGVHMCDAMLLPAAAAAAASTTAPAPMCHHRAFSPN